MSGDFNNTMVDIVDQINSFRTFPPDDLAITVQALIEEWKLEQYILFDCKKKRQLRRFFYSCYL
jgi:hypothetical protein